MYDKQYYDSKFRELNERLKRKQVNFINDVISLASRYLSDDKEIGLAGQELTKRNEEAKKKGIELLDKEGKPIVKEPKKK